jgi:hypothetical protein
MIKTNLSAFKTPSPSSAFLSPVKNEKEINQLNCQNSLKTRSKRKSYSSKTFQSGADYLSDNSCASCDSHDSVNINPHKFKTFKISKNSTNLNLIIDTLKQLTSELDLIIIDLERSESLQKHDLIEAGFHAAMYVSGSTTTIIKCVSEMQNL